MPPFGAHMSVAGGLHEAFARGKAAGCDCLQVFVKNQRQWRAPRLTEEAVAAWRRAARETGIGPVVAHATYLINLASPRAALRRRSVATLVLELERCEALGVAALIVHPGAHMGAGEREGCRTLSGSVREVLRGTCGMKGSLLLEVTAGQGTSLGWRFEHLGEVLDRLHGPARLGICLDTCHAVAAGHLFDTPERYGEMMDRIGRIAGIDRIRAFHLNDSIGARGSRVDRHTHLGKGRVGLCAFRLIVNDRRFRNVPMILETPKGMDARGRDLDRVNLSVLRRLARS